MDPVTSLIGTISHLFDYMNPSRSPYMLAVIVGAIVLFLFKDEAAEGAYLSELMFIIPIFIATALFVLLSLRFKDRLLRAIKDANELKIELNGQFRFARAVAVACSLVAFYMIWDAHLDYGAWPNQVAYLIVAIHLLTFLSYSSIYNNRLHFVRRKSLLQIAIIMSAILLIVVDASTEITPSDGEVWFSCETKYGILEKPMDGDVMLAATGQLLSAENSAPLADSDPLFRKCSTQDVEMVRQPDQYGTERLVSLAVFGDVGDDATFVTLRPAVIYDLDGSAVVFLAFGLLWVIYAGFWGAYFADVIGASKRARRGARNANDARLRSI